MGERGHKIARVSVVRGCYGEFRRRVNMREREDKEWRAVWEEMRWSGYGMGGEARYGSDNVMEDFIGEV